jgi:hypothetical protein
MSPAHILRCEAYGELEGDGVEGLSGLLLQLCDGDLEDYLQETGPLPEKEAAGLLKQVGAHEQQDAGIGHRSAYADQHDIVLSRVLTTCATVTSGDVTQSAADIVLGYTEP